MAIQSSFPKVADQIVMFNQNIIEILSKINNLTTTNENSVNIDINDEEGVLTRYSLPSFKSIQNQINRLNNNINSLYGLDGAGSIVETSSSNKFKKVISVELNRDPVPVNSLGDITTFKSKNNWFFDSMMSPSIQIKLDLSGKIENNVSKCLIKRYIINFETENGQLTENGQSALNSFNKKYNGNGNIIIDEFLEWHRNTPGVIDSSNPKYDREEHHLEPNRLEYDGEFTVLKIEEDRLNNKLWYVLNSLSFFNIEANQEKELSVGDELIVNSSSRTSTRYKIIEISNSTDVQPKIRVERVEGMEPIPTGVGTLKIYSPVIYTKNLGVNVGYNEYNVVFIKPINGETNIIAKKWSLGTGFYTNSLRLDSDTDENGLTMESFYTDYVYDYGSALKDLTSKKIPNKLAATPDAPTIDLNNFKVVQINKHLSSKRSQEIKQKHNQQSSLKEEIKQLQQAITEKNKKRKVVKYQSTTEKEDLEQQTKNLIDKKNSKSNLLSSITQEVIDISNEEQSRLNSPKFRLRGFWDFPEPVQNKKTLPQEIIQFIIQYRYISKDGNEPPTEEFKLKSGEKASFSNWNEIKTDTRKRIYDSDTGEYFWQIEDVESSDVKNINQVDIPINKNEQIEFRVKSISEVGWPESPVESDWSEIKKVSFPDDLDNVLNENENILQETYRERIKTDIESDLKSKGLEKHLNDTINFNDKEYFHSAENILSGYTDENGGVVSLYKYIERLENKIQKLEDKLNDVNGILNIVLMRNNEEFTIENGGELSFNIQCEDYMTRYDGGLDKNDRIYENKIYSIKDFVLLIKNTAPDSPLGLLTDKNYLQENKVYNDNAPQVFWVNDSDELIKSDITGETLTQLNNQFLWQVNYDSATDNDVSKISENIGNSFIANNNNSLTPVLESEEYNIGYNENEKLSFVGNNNSLTENEKWIDTSPSVSSTNKLLTTIHPVVEKLEDLVEKNSEKVKTIQPGENNLISIPINVYFKINSLDTSQPGLNYEYVDLKRQTSTIIHEKKLKFLLENKASNKPFVFTLKFKINRNSIIQRTDLRARL